MKRFLLLFCLLFLYAQEHNKKSELDKWANKRLLEGTANNPINKDYSKEQLKKFNSHLKILTTRANNSDTSAMVGLGNLNYLGTGHKIFPQNLPVAVQWFEKATSLGNLEAMYNLGICYQYGAGVQRNKTKALELFERSVNNGLYKIAFKVASLFEEQKDFKKARKYYIISANATKQIEALKKVAGYYMDGIGGKKLQKDAFRYYSTTALKGDADSQYALAKIFINNEVINRDYDKSMSWLELAASNGNSQAQLDLGILYLDGSNKYVKNHELALKWIQKSVKLGNIDAQLTLGEIYDGRKGNKADYKKAYYWYRLVAFRDRPEAMLKLGLCYEFGKGVEVNPKKAIQWYTKSATKNHAPAFLRLGHIYEQGFIVKKDIKRALIYYNKAILLNSGEASVYLAKAYKEGVIVEKNNVKAFKLLKDAAVKGYEPALQVLENYN